MSDSYDGPSDWRAYTAWLTSLGVPKRRAQVVALRVEGRTYADIADVLGMSGKAEANKHAREYNRQKKLAAKLAENGPEL